MPYKLRLSTKPDAEVHIFLTIGEVAKKAGKSKDALKRLTYRGIMPEANYRTPPIQIKRGENKGKSLDGYRLYSRDFLAPKLIEFLRCEVSRGKQITLDQRAELLRLFQSERDYFSNK